jgi:hypothetical protein
MQTIVVYLCYIVLILLFLSAYNTSLIYCFLIWCLHTNQRRPCSSTLSGHPSSSWGPLLLLSVGPCPFLTFNSRCRPRWLFLPLPSCFLPPFSGWCSFIDWLLLLSYFLTHGDKYSLRLYDWAVVTRRGRSVPGLVRPALLRSGASNTCCVFKMVRAP